VPLLTKSLVIIECEAERSWNDIHMESFVGRLLSMETVESPPGLVDWKGQHIEVDLAGLAGSACR